MKLNSHESNFKIKGKSIRPKTVGDLGLCGCGEVVMVSNMDVEISWLKT